jgi:hypothetical protein
MIATCPEEIKEYRMQPALQLMMVVLFCNATKCRAALAEKAAVVALLCSCGSIKHQTSYMMLLVHEVQFLHVSGLHSKAIYLLLSKYLVVNTLMVVL